MVKTLCVCDCVCVCVMAPLKGTQGMQGVDALPVDPQAPGEFKTNSAGAPVL